MSMSKAYQVTGGTPLHGTVRIGGAKNASYKLMIASLLAEKESILLNLSNISDVQTVAEIIGEMGAKVLNPGERSIAIDPHNVSSFDLSHINGAQGRFSTMFIPALLVRFGKAIVPLPGGDKIGVRPLERHFDGLRAMGATIEQKDNLVICHASKLHGTDYTFEKNTHTGTETLIMAAVRAEGETVLSNAAQEPEVDDLIEYLNKMGAKISRHDNRVIKIEGVDSLKGTTHQIIPDRNEAVSYACAALTTKGDIVIENARPSHLKAFLEQLDQIGAGYEVGNYGMRFYYEQPLQATTVTTTIEPGFMTDWQPLFATVLTQCEGVSVVHETIMQNRFQYVDQLQTMGAQIEKFQPQVENPDEVYNFNLIDDEPNACHAIRIKGPTNLKSGKFEVHDLRQGATLILAALTAQGTSIIRGIEHVDRGYEALAERLNSMGAKIERIAVD